MAIYELAIALSICLAFALGEKWGKRNERKYFLDFLEKYMEE